jgi:hypothetical protein
VDRSVSRVGEGEIGIMKNYSGNTVICERCDGTTSKKTVEK